MQQAAHQRQGPAAPGGRSPRAVGAVAGVALTHADRILYPEEGITKLHLARYYEEIAPWILPHVASRPLTLVRCPSGLGAKCFHQQHPLRGLPGVVRRVEVEEKDGPATHLYIDSIQGLIALVQVSVLELHVWGCRIDRIDRPDSMIFDLDPGPGVSWARLVACARDLAGTLAGIGLDSFPRLTGGKGLHLVVPLARRHGWREVKAFAAALAAREARARPDRYTARSAKSRRQGRIFIDYLRNGRGATAIACYSTRARPGAPVAAPVAWDELEGLARPAAFALHNLPDRLRELGRDPWSGFDDARATLTRAMREQVGLSR